MPVRTYEHKCVAIMQNICGVFSVKM